MNWMRWLKPGLVLTILVALAAIIVENRPMEGDIGARVAAALAAEGQTWALVEVSARDVTVRGVAPSTESQETALRTARRVAGVRSVSDGSDLLPIASPYIWSARRDGRAVLLSGSVPSEGSRASVLAAARRALPDGEIRDAMVLARGAPSGFNTATTFGLTRLADFGEGVVTLTDSTLALSGTASSAESYANARAAVDAGAPAAISFGPVDILPARADPFVWSANFDGKSITFVGFVPNEIVHDTLVATAKASLPGVPILDSVAIASGAPAGFAEAATFAISALERLSQGGVTLDGLRLDVTGGAKSVADYDALLASLSGPLPDGVTVVAAAITPAAVADYGFTGERSGGRVTLTGYVPTAVARDDVAATARIMFAGAELVDRVRVAAGEPRMDWIGAVKFAMGELAKLDRGKVTLDAQSYTIEGAAASPEAYTDIVATNAKTLPASLTLAASEVTPPSVSPFTFHAQRDGAGLVLSGYVPGTKERDTLVALAQRKFGKGPIRDELVFAAGAPEDFTSATSAALQVVSRLEGGRVDLADRAVSVSGLVYNPAAVEAIGGTLDDLPEGYTVATNAVTTGQPGQPIAADRCRDVLQAALQTGSIRFDGTSADLVPDSVGVLDRVSAAVRRCAGVIIEVGAHSDSEGSTSRNRDRTQARADAIVDFLVDAGVKRESLTAVGYGESKPIADNGTEEGKAANQRIEFTVQVPESGG